MVKEVLPTVYKNASDTVEFFQGKAKWVRFDKVNDWGKWTMVLYPNDKSLARIRDLQGEGVKNVIKKDDDGYYTTFSRPNSKLMRGKIVNFEPVVVVDKDSQPFEGRVG